MTPCFYLFLVFPLNGNTHCRIAFYGRLGGQAIHVPIVKKDHILEWMVYYNQFIAAFQPNANEKVLTCLGCEIDFVGIVSSAILAAVW